jgi:hypothetical protein
MQQCIKILLFFILYEAHHVLGDTSPIIRSLKLHKQPLVLHTWKADGRAVVGRCQVAYERVQWVAYAKNLNHRYQYRHYKECNTKRNPLRLQSYGFSLLVTKACPNCPHTHKFQPPRLFVFIICTRYNKKRKTDTFGFGFACVAKFSQLTETMNAGKAHSKLLTLHATSTEERK